MKKHDINYIRRLFFVSLFRKKFTEVKQVNAAVSCELGHNLWLQRCYHENHWGQEMESVISKMAQLEE